MINSKKYIISFFSLIIFLTSCKTNYNVVKVDLRNKPSTKDGFYYNLPKNIIKISLDIEKQDNIKGPYSDFAKQYFGLTNVITQSSSNFSIKNVRVETISEIDSSQIYFVESNDASLKINFNESGMIKDINCVENLHSDNGNNSYKALNNNEMNNYYPSLFKKFADLNIYEKVDTILRKVKVDTAYIIEKTFKTSLVEKPLDLKAKEIVDYISKIKEARFNLISGEIDVIDKKNIEFMYQELQNQEEQYLKLFTGITINNTNTYDFFYYPLKDTNYQITKIDICKFSSSKGITSEEGPDIENISLQIDYTKNLSNLFKYNQLKNNKKKSKNGFFYRIPAIAELRLMKNNSVIYNCQKSIAQSGIVLSLPQKNISIKFDEKTGSITLLKIN